MAISKVILNGDTLMDVTGDTVNSGNLLSPETATRNDGVRVTGSVDLSTYVLKAGDTMTGTLNLTSNLIKIRDYGTSATSLMYVDTANSVHRNVITTSSANIFGFRQYNKEETSPALAAGTYYETYLLPEVSTGLTQNKTYYILTTKAFNPFYAAGDTFATSTAATYRPIWNGVVASNDKTLYLCVYVDKSLDAISSIAVTTLTGWIYGTDGPIESSITTTDWVSNYNVTALKAADKIVRLAITKKDSTVFTNAVGYTAINGSLNTVLTFA